MELTEKYTKEKNYSFILSVGLAASSQAQVDFTAGETVPDFTVTDLEGNTHTLYDYTAAGKYVLVDFYAYWCGPCMQDAPYVNEFYHKYGCNTGSVIVIAVEYEGTEDQCHGFEESAGINDENPFPVCCGIEGGGAAVHSAYGAAAFPTYIAITPENILLDNDIWPMGADPVATLEAAFPEGALVEMECIIGVSEVAALNSFSVAPNPATNNAWLSLQLTSDINDVTIMAYDATGKLMMSEKPMTSDGGRIMLNTSSWGAGIYHLQMMGNGQVLHTEKLIVE